MMKKRNAKCVLGVLASATMLCSLCLYGCGGKNEASQPVEDNRSEVSQSVDEKPVSEAGVQDIVQDISQDDFQKEPSGEDLDVVEPDDADNDWYLSGSTYIDDSGRRLEVFFDDEGMLEFAVDGLSLYYTTTDNFQQENDWKVYTCDDGTFIVYYPGEPAHLEISDGDYAGIYEEETK